MTGRWIVEAAVGEPPISNPADAATVKELSADVVLALDGPSIPAEDVLVLNAFADQLAAVLEHGRLRVEAGRARALADANELRGALLQAVSHDLRTPLASIKACATSLRNHDVTWSAEETAEFVTTIDAETDRLTALVGNLLDMSRVQAGVIQPSTVPTPPEEVVLAAVLSLGQRGGDRRRRCARIASRSARRSGPARAGDRQRRRQRDYVQRRWRTRAGGRRQNSPSGVEIRVVDRGPGSQPSTGSGCSSRSSGSATAGPAGSAWDSPSPTDS